MVAYILKMRRRRFEVPFSTLWQRVLREKEATSLWRRLKRLLLAPALSSPSWACCCLRPPSPQLGKAAQRGQERGHHARRLGLDEDASTKATTAAARASMRPGRRSSGCSTPWAAATPSWCMRMDGQSDAADAVSRATSPRYRSWSARSRPPTRPADLRPALTRRRRRPARAPEPAHHPRGRRRLPEDALAQRAWKSRARRRRAAPNAGDRPRSRQRRGPPRSMRHRPRGHRRSLPARRPRGRQRRHRRLQRPPLHHQQDLATRSSSRCRTSARRPARRLLPCTTATCPSTSRRSSSRPASAAPHLPRPRWRRRQRAAGRARDGADHRPRARRRRRLRPRRHAWALLPEHKRKKSLAGDRTTTSISRAPCWCTTISRSTS